MDRYKMMALVLCGFTAGIVYAFGCGTTNGGHPFGIDSAFAADSCNQWEMRMQDDKAAIPPGWEPFAWQPACASGFECLALRRCAE